MKVEWTLSREEKAKAGQWQTWAQAGTPSQDGLRETLVSGLLNHFWRLQRVSPNVYGTQCIKIIWCTSLRRCVLVPMPDRLNQPLFSFNKFQALGYTPKYGSHHAEIPLPVQMAGKSWITGPSRASQPGAPLGIGVLESLTDWGIKVCCNMGASLFHILPSLILGCTCNPKQEIIQSTAFSIIFRMK